MKKVWDDMLEAFQKGFKDMGDGVGGRLRAQGRRPTGTAPSWRTPTPRLHRSSGGASGSRRTAPRSGAQPSTTIAPRSRTLIPMST